MSIQAYLNELYKRLFKTKSYGTVMSDDILAYRLLKSANLSSYHEELMKATIPDLQYDIMKNQGFQGLDHFLPFSPTNNPTNQNFEKMKKKKAWRYHRFTLLYHK